MKTKFVGLFVVVLLLSACNYKENTLVGDLRKFSTQLLKESSKYTEEDWEESEKVYDALKLSLSRTTLTEKEAEKVIELQKICDLQYSLLPVRKLQSLTKTLDNYQNLTSEQWEEAKSTYSSVFENMTGFVYSADRLTEIDSLNKQCLKYFSMQPVVELLELCKCVKNNNAHITSAQRDSLKLRHDEIKRELSCYEYDAYKSEQIVALNDTISAYIKSTRWSSMKNTVREDSKELIEKMYEWLDKW